MLEARDGRLSITRQGDAGALTGPAPSTSATASCCDPRTPSRPFERVLSGAGDPATTVRGVARGVRENRVALWSAHHDEQSLLAASGIGGAFGAGTRPTIGVFTQDATASKMQYYLRQRTVVSTSRCRSDGSAELAVTTTLTSTAPARGAGLSRYVTGTGARTPRGSMRLEVDVFAPRGGQVLGSTVDGRPTLASSGEQSGQPGALHGVLLAPGRRTEIVTTVTTAPGSGGAVVLTTTPGVGGGDNDVLTGSACRSSASG